MHVATTSVLFSLFIASWSLPSPHALQDLTYSRIVNGYEVDITETPYQASLRRKSLSGWVHLCGAAIIATKAVLTAAHCVNTYQTDPTLLRVTVGTAYRLSNGKSYDTKRIIIHEDYSSATLENDIALLVINSKMTYSSSVNAISVAPKNYFLPNGTEALVSGFGAVLYEGSASTKLLAAKVKIVDQSTCIRAYLGMASVTSKMICASGTNPPRDACQGDSGGPLVADNLLVGIVSWGEKCAELKYPGVYTRVSEYESWVQTRLDLYT